MNITLNKSEFKHILLASTFMSWTLQVANMIWIKSTDGVVNVYINNMSEYFSSTFTPINKCDDWEFAVDWKLLRSIVSKAKWDMTFKVVWEEVLITTDWTKLKLRKLHYWDMVKEREVSWDKLTIEQSVLQAWTDLVFAVPQKHFKTVYTWLSLLAKDNYIEFCGTNELKIAIYREEVNHNFDCQLLIPYEFVNKIKSLLSSWKYVVDVSTDANKILITLSDWDNSIRLSSLLLNWTYPAYQWILWVPYTTNVKTRCSDILESQGKLSILMWAEDLVQVTIWDWIEFKFTWDVWEISDTIKWETNTTESFNVKSEFFHVIKFIQSLWIDDVSFIRQWRFIFIDTTNTKYKFIAAASDIK